MVSGPRSGLARARCRRLFGRGCQDGRATGRVRVSFAKQAGTMMMMRVRRLPRTHASRSIDCGWFDFISVSVQSYG
eukprot:scaffold117_cov148-Amphora_coffeaeformis.AAC.4